MSFHNSYFDDTLQEDHNDNHDVNDNASDDHDASDLIDIICNWKCSDILNKGRTQN